MKRKQEEGIRGMDYYQTLGIRRGASKEEVKEAFRRSALKFHPDRHSLSSPATRDQAATRFRQISEAYQILIDDRRRAEYDFSARTSPGGAARHSTSRGYSYGRAAGIHRRPAFDWEFLLRYLTGRRFLLHVALASAMVGSAIAIERSGETIWKMNNAGKSFEEAMESIEKVRKSRDDG